MSDSRPIVAVPIFIHRGCVYLGTRGKGSRKGFLNLPGGFTEEHNDHHAVAEAVEHPERRLGFDNRPDGELIADAAVAELEEETGYVGPRLKARLYEDALATSMHERLVFVLLVVAERKHFDADPAAWFSPDAVKTPGELLDGRWICLKNLPPREKWAFPIFYEMVANLDFDPFPLRPRNRRVYVTTP